MRLLLAEDEKHLSKALVTLLKYNNYSVDAVYNGQDALDYLETGIYDGVILDIMMPKLDGISVLKELRARGNNVPVLMLTAKSEIEDKCLGLDLGADDYLAKPFKTAELIARINALVRRPPVYNSQELGFGDLKFDVTNRTLSGEPLTDKEADILSMFMKNPGSTVTKEQILTHVWGNEMVHDDNYVEVYVSYLRKKLKNLGSKVKIKTIRGLGYKLENQDV